MNHDVRLRIECALPARFLDQAVSAGARLYNVRLRSHRILTTECDEGSAEILTRLCKSFHLDVRVLRRRSFRALARKLQSRWTLALGILLGVCICGFVLCRIWRIEIAFTGAYADLGDEQAILSCLETESIRPGTRRSKIDADALGKRISAVTDGFSYVGVHADGVILRIEASPETPVPDVYDLARARDLVASRDGIVESVFVRSGQACVSPGDTVSRGQTLIRGEERSSNGETVPVAALGEVIARCWHEGCAQEKIRRSLTVRTGQTRSESALCLFGETVALTRCEPFLREETESETLPVVGAFLPLEIRRTSHYETRITEITIEPVHLERRLATLARADALLDLERENPQYHVLSEWTDAEIADNEIRVRAVIEAAADIAVTRDALN